MSKILMFSLGENIEERLHNITYFLERKSIKISIY